MSGDQDEVRLQGRGILVTGGAGFIASHLVDRLIAEEPSTIVVVDNMFLGKEENLQLAFQAFPALKLYREDVSDYGAMRQILAAEQIEVVFDLAVIPLPTSLERPRWTVDINVGMATCMCELLREGFFETLVHFSSSEVYGTAQYIPMDERHPIVPLTPYAASKAAADQVVLSYHHTFDIDAAIIRPFNTFGPRQNDRAYAGVIPSVVERVLQGQDAIVYGDGEQSRDFNYVADVAEAAVRVYKNPAARGQAVNVASGTETSINSLVRQMLQLLESDADIVHVAPRSADVRRHVGSSTLLRKLTGEWTTRTLTDGLRETLAWYCTALPRQQASLG
ncbi:MAG: NAD-dependent epimerase/dehydratase family protein [Actinomycetota bacterium]|nr:NAD-dependent epimerase/dehydratase family protein [Actinomycetota bacterium]